MGTASNARPQPPSSEPQQGTEWGRPDDISWEQGLSFVCFHIHLIRVPPGDRGPPQLERHSERLLIKLLLAKSGMHMHRRAGTHGGELKTATSFATVCNSLRSQAKARPVLAPCRRARGVGCTAGPKLRWHNSSFPRWWSSGFPGTCGTPRAAATSGEKGQVGAEWRLVHGRARRRKSGKDFRPYRWLSYRPARPFWEGGGLQEHCVLCGSDLPWPDLCNSIRTSGQ